MIAIHRWIRVIPAVAAVFIAAQHLRADPKPPQAPPPKPDYPTLPAKGAQATGLIVITHGWNSSPKYWPDGENGTGNDPQKGLKAKITAQLGNDANKWDIVPYDWSNIQAGGQQFGAATGSAFSLSENLKLADQARLNATNIGTFLGQKINDAGYEKVHFYSHSAGSWLNDWAADQMKAKGSAATLQQTFLDTFMPLKDVKDDLGDSATFAIQYVDAREYAQDKPFTNATLKHAYNLDITKLDPQPNRGFTSGAHGWPHEWYRQTTDNPAAAIAHSWGYNRSLEKGSMPSFGDNIQGRQVAKNVRHALPPPEQPQPPKQAPVVPQPKLDFRGGIKSNSGAMIDMLDGTSFTLDANQSDAPEPEAWVAAEFQISQAVNLLHFNYLFESLSPGLPGQGWFTMYLNDELLFHSDERFARTFLQEPESEYLLLGTPLTPGLHSLAFRLDPFSSDPSYGLNSTLGISDVWFTFAPELVPEPRAAVLLAIGLAALLYHRRQAPGITLRVS